VPSGVNIKTYNIDGIGSFHLVEVGPGKWCWQTPGFQWQYDEKIPPPDFNVAMYVDGFFHFQLRVGTIEFALCYTMGFAYGYKNGFTQGKADADGAAEMHRQIFQEELEKDKQRPEVKADAGITGNSSVP